MIIGHNNIIRNYKKCKLNATEINPKQIQKIECSKLSWIAITILLKRLISYPIIQKITVSTPLSRPFWVLYFVL